MYAAARAFFRPEFLNRIDEMVIFEPLASQAVNKIIQLEIAGNKKYCRDTFSPTE